MRASRLDKDLLSRLDHELALRQMLRRFDQNLPIQVGNRWVEREQLVSLLQLARYQPTRWARLPVERSETRHADALTFRSASNTTDEPILHPWETGEGAARREQRPPTTELVPLDTAHSMVGLRAGTFPAVIATVNDQGTREHPARRWSLPATLDADTFESFGAVPRRELERAAVGRLATGSTVIAILRDEKGSGHIADLELPAGLESAPGILTTNVGGLAISYRPASGAVLGLVGRDAVVRFPHRMTS